MPPRSPFRLLAPGALLAVVVAVVLVVTGGSSTDPSATVASTTTKESAAKRPKRRTYTVKANDNLTSIAERFGLSVDELTELNPRVDPQSIRTGQRLRLRD